MKTMAMVNLPKEVRARKRTENGDVFIDWQHF